MPRKPDLNAPSKITLQDKVMEHIKKFGPVTPKQAGKVLGHDVRLKFRRLKEAGLIKEVDEPKFACVAV